MGGDWSSQGDKDEDRCREEVDSKAGRAQVAGECCVSSTDPWLQGLVHLWRDCLCVSVCFFPINSIIRCELCPLSLQSEGPN